MVEVTDMIIIMGIDDYSRTRKKEDCFGLALFMMHDTNLLEEFCRFSGFHISSKECVQQFLHISVYILT